ncbi:MAG: RpiB/LacA/LacB family sugar-phosphate isomerase [Candidatus Staskawiczbacteria bacterium]|nr:RpiB/LacA/LacB family sugar-phosphate isomerase [Candidatus Staskawiczbacteria bacterium]
MLSIKDKIVILGADHNGVDLKSIVKEHLSKQGYFCVDIGPHDGQVKVDYVDYAAQLGKIIENNEAGFGILMCGTGVGMSMVANKFSNARAALVHNLETAPKSREHNNANILCLGAWINSPEMNLEIIDAWFGQKFGEGRHVPRVEKFPGANTGKKVVFTNGVFDILHPGHFKVLKFAKSLGDKLIVGINSDRAVKILKGETRPINSQDIRKSALEALDFVDEVVIFDDVKTQDIIAQINPNVVVKGGEWTAEEVRRRDNIPAHIEVKVCPVLEGFSTTNLINKILGKQ